MNRPIVLITGSTDGIGKATAQDLISRGAEVILHGRNTRKGNRVRKELAEITGNTAPDLLIADLSSPDQVRQMAEEITSHYTRLDVLINNAGTYEKKGNLRPAGWKRPLPSTFLPRIF